MHIPDNYLSPQTCAVMTAAMVPVWAVSVHKMRKEFSRDEIALPGTCAAFSFLGMMFNIPLPGGTTGHAVGGTLLAMLEGPYAACISMSVALLLQAVLFGDGGILAFGANCFNMAFVLPFTGYAVYRALSGKISGEKGRMIGAAAGSYIGINAAALAAAIEFGIQPMLFKDAAGQALYCPYGLSTAIPAMMIGHLTLFGLAEVLFTLVIWRFLEKAAPARVAKRDRIGLSASPAVKVFLAAKIVLTPLGLLAEGTAWGEWGTDEIAATGAGYTPAGMENGFSFESMIPDYSVAGLPDAAGYILSAVIGAAVLIILFRLVMSAGKRAQNAA